MQAVEIDTQEALMQIRLNHQLHGVVIDVLQLTFDSDQGYRAVGQWHQASTEFV